MRIDTLGWAFTSRESRCVILYIYIYIYTHIIHIHIDRYICIYIHIYIYICMHMHVSVCVCARSSYTTEREEALPQSKMALGLLPRFRDSNYIIGHVAVILGTNTSEAMNAWALSSLGGAPEVPR